MALRGVRPSPEEIDAVAEHPEALPLVARSWLLDPPSAPRFGAMIRDMHAEQFLTRTDTHWQLPDEGPLQGLTPAQRAESIDDEPLRLVEWIVRTGRPYTDIVTSDKAVGDPYTQAAYGIVPDEHQPVTLDGGWQVGTWWDGRPAAGVLSSTTLWQRHMSGDVSHHRRRANFVLSTLLCDPLPEGSVFSAPLVEDVRTEPGCAGCHVRLDPLAAAFFGFERYILAYEVSYAYLDGCPPDQEKFCYPLRFWDESMVDDRERNDMPPPALDGVPVADAAELGEVIAADPRFAECTARRFGAYLTQTAVEDVPDDQVARWQEILVSTGFDARELALAVVLDESFSPETGTAPRQLVRGEQLDRMLEELTGYTWDAEPPEGWGPVRSGSTDEYGFRTLLGGLNGWDSLRPDHHPMPTRELAMAWAASEAAAWAVDHGKWPPGPPGEQGGVVVGEEAVRAALTQLHHDVLAELEPDIEPTFELWQQTLALTGDPARAWKVVGTAMLLDHDVVTY
jgi:hypothetical protein